MTFIPHLRRVVGKPRNTINALRKLIHRIDESNESKKRMLALVAHSIIFKLSDTVLNSIARKLTIGIYKGYRVILKEIAEVVVRPVSLIIEERMLAQDKNRAEIMAQKILRAQKWRVKTEGNPNIEHYGMDKERTWIYNSSRPTQCLSGYGYFQTFVKKIGKVEIDQ